MTIVGYFFLAKIFNIISLKFQRNIKKCWPEIYPFKRKIEIYKKKQGKMDFVSKYRRIRMIGFHWFKFG
jgi:hypothetical protein